MSIDNATKEKLITSYQKFSPQKGNECKERGRLCRGLKGGRGYGQVYATLVDTAAFAGL